MIALPLNPRSAPACHRRKPPSRATSQSAACTYPARHTYWPAIAPLSSDLRQADLRFAIAWTVKPCRHCASRLGTNDQNQFQALDRMADDLHKIGDSGARRAPAFCSNCGTLLCSHADNQNQEFWPAHRLLPRASSTCTYHAHLACFGAKSGRWP
jgi:ribosomal protein S27AE